MGNGICCISAKADWFEATKLCRQIKEKLSIDVDILGSDGNVQNYDVIIYLHSSKSALDSMVNKCLNEACNVNKSFVPVVTEHGWLVCKKALSKYKGPDLRTRFLLLYREKDSYEFFNRLASVSGTKLKGDVLGAEVTIVSDRDCKVYRDNDCLATIQSNVPYIISLYVGYHRLIFKANEDERIQYEEIVQISSTKQKHTLYAIFKSPNVIAGISKGKSGKNSTSSGLLTCLFFTIAIVAAIFFVIKYQPKSSNNSEDYSCADTVSVNEELYVEDVVNEDSLIIDFITDMFDNHKYINYDFLEKHSTSHLLEKLEEDYYYEHDSIEHHYATWDFRTSAMDGKPDFEGTNGIINVESLGNGWFAYEFYDCGWLGRKRVKALIQDGVVMMDALETLYDECLEYQKQINEKEAFRIKTLFEKNGSHKLEGFMVYSDSTNYENISISFNQINDVIDFACYVKEGRDSEIPEDRVVLTGVKTLEGYHFEADESYGEFTIDITLKDLSFRGFLRRNGERLNIDLHFEY